MQFDRYLFVKKKVCAIVLSRDISNKERTIGLMEQAVFDRLMPQ